MELTIFAGAGEGVLDWIWCRVGYVGGLVELSCQLVFFLLFSLLATRSGGGGMGNGYENAPGC